MSTNSSKHTFPFLLWLLREREGERLSFLKESSVDVWYLLVTAVWAAALPLSCHIPGWDPGTPGVAAACRGEMEMLLLAFWDQARRQSDTWVRLDVAGSGALQPLNLAHLLASEGLEDILNFLLLKMKLGLVLRCFVNQDWISLHVLSSYCLKTLDC